MSGNLGKARKFLNSKMSELQEKRFSMEEALEVLSECHLIRESLVLLEEKARKDLSYQLNKPQLRVVE